MIFSHLYRCLSVCLSLSLFPIHIIHLITHKQQTHIQQTDTYVVPKVQKPLECPLNLSANSFISSKSPIITSLSFAVYALTLSAALLNLRAHTHTHTHRETVYQYYYYFIIINTYTQSHIHIHIHIYTHTTHTYTHKHTNTHFFLLFTARYESKIRRNFLFSPNNYCNFIVSFAFQQISD